MVYLRHSLGWWIVSAGVFPIEQVIVFMNMLNNLGVAPLSMVAPPPPSLVLAVVMALSGPPPARGRSKALTAAMICTFFHIKSTQQGAKQPEDLSTHVTVSIQ